MRRAEEFLRPLAESRNVRLEIMGDLGTSVEGDADELEQVFANLIENAVKFTGPSGRVEVELSTIDGPEGASHVLVKVTDTGIGIPAAEIPRVFDRFFRASNAQQQAVQGTGLGLAIVREIADGHHGTTSVSSVLGEGTTVSVTLPARREPAVRE